MSKYRIFSNLSYSYVYYHRKLWKKIIAVSEYNMKLIHHAKYSHMAQGVSLNHAPYLPRVDKRPLENFRQTFPHIVHWQTFLSAGNGKRRKIIHNAMLLMICRKYARGGLYRYNYSKITWASKPPDTTTKSIVCSKAWWQRKHQNSALLAHCMCVW